MKTKDQQSNLAKNFIPQDIESTLYQQWEDAGYFGVSNDDPRPAYTIVIPPPNVTGALHMGHALDHTLQDILIRFKRMDGFATLWLPGTDHAGIATQNVVERELEKKGQSRQEMGRKAFIDQVWEWKKQYGSRIVEQIRRMGSSCDWSRERFTFDEGLSHAVRHAFVSLYNEDLIYRSTYLVNWDPKNQTAISDLEVEYQEVKGMLTYFQYPLEQGGHITVATTRPETMLGDTAIAVAPDDDRYQNIIGQYALHPWLDRKIPIIADPYVKKEFGTGAVKITPAHDPNDYEMGLRHQLDMISILNKDGTMNEHAGPFQGLDCKEARKKIIAGLQEKQLLVKQEEHLHQVGHSQRSGAVIEPLLSKQWFVRTEPLAQEALAAVQTSKTTFIPEKWNKTYYQWLENIRDWCISRQLWWGHQIPVWYCDDCQKETAAIEDPATCQHCQSHHIQQDPDVLDTWFSSGLWPFSTLGWPDASKDMEKFFPTQVLVTGFDIIFFWVARMMMMSLKFTQQVPFEKVHIHALIRDEHGQKMSKSKGNVVDPIDLIDRYGADALRFSLCALSVQGRDILLSEKKIEGIRNFINKLWNAGKFVEHVCQDQQQAAQPPQPTLSINQWIVHRLHEVIGQVRHNLELMKFNEIADQLYHFIWHEFCDWYLELSKPHLYGQHVQEKQETIQTLLYAYNTILQLTHPIMPFVTETLWQNLPLYRETKSIMLSSYPQTQKLTTEVDMKKISHLMACITLIRTIRSAHTIKPSTKISIHLWNQKNQEVIDFLQSHAIYMQELANVDHISYSAPASKENTGYDVIEGTEIAISLEGLVDAQEELQRLQKEEKKALDDIQFLSKKLKNPKFVAKAPEKLVQETKDKLKQAELTHQKLQEQLQQHSS
ncbi:MAG: valine--tRNA ligase [Deltaproteobacteria bacterium]|nr:valine--tRNA ligase [Deltaproteobacteria bacterium]